MSPISAVSSPVSSRPIDESLAEKLPGAILDLLEAGGNLPAGDVPVELIAHASTRVRVAAT